MSEAKTCSLTLRLRRRDLLAEKHGKGIGLLASAAPGNPDADCG